ncbi:MAG: hypothetical protein AB1938_03900 [Myxococcota bacterium]
MTALRVCLRLVRHTRLAVIVRVAALCFTLVLAACRFDASLPPDASVTCRTSDDCPPGTSCNLLERRCVALPGVDNVAPTLAAPATITYQMSDPQGRSLQLDGVGPASQVAIGFSTNEPLGEVPVLSACGLACVTSAQSTRFDFVCTTGDSTERVDSCAVSARLVDLFGNLAVEPLGVVRIDTEPPQPPDTLTPGRVVYTRAPWGSRASNGVPRMSVVGGAGAVADARWVSFAVKQVVGITPVDVDGGFTWELSQVDSPALSAFAVDGAGNASAPVLIHDVEWIAMPALDETADNPHGLFSVGAAGRALVRPDARIIFSLSPDAGLSVLGMASWERRTFAAPPPTSLAALAVERDRGRIIRFGGVMDAGSSFPVSPNTTWAWNGSGWSELDVGDPEGDGNPVGRPGVVLGWDAPTSSLLAVGGLTGAPFLDAWSFNGSSWKRLPNGPRSRFGAAGFFDRARRRMVLVGGTLMDGDPTRETITFDGVTWRALDAGFTGNFVLGRAAWDPRRQVGWLAGGIAASPDGGTVPSRELWRFENDTWSRHDAGAPALHELLWDEARDLLMGISLESGTAEVFEFDGEQWRSYGTDGGAPRGRDLTATWDPASGKAFVTTTTEQAGLASWTWDSATRQWSRQSAPLVQLEPWPARPAFTCTPLVCLGVGSFRTATGTRPATAALTDYGWTEVPVSSAPPWNASTLTAFAGNQLAWVGRAGVEVDAGALALQFGPTGSAFTWRQPQFSAVQLDSPAATPFADGALVTGGGKQVHFWSNDGGWEPDFAQLDIDLLKPSMVTREDGGVLVSGASPSSSLSHTFLVTGNGPAQRLSTSPFLLGSALVWDNGRGAALAFGGLQAGLSTISDLFELSATGWERVPISDPQSDGNPMRRMDAAFSWSATRQVSVLVGGTNPPDEFVDVWYFRYAEHRPALHFIVELPQTEFLPGTTIEDLSLHAECGGSGFEGGVPSLGVEVLLWRDGAWERLGTSTAPFSGPDSVVASTSDHRLIADALRSARLGFALTPVGTNGRGTARLGVTSLEVHLRYRLP